MPASTPPNRPDWWEKLTPAARRPEWSSVSPASLACITRSPGADQSLVTASVTNSCNTMPTLRPTRRGSSARGATPPSTATSPYHSARRRRSRLTTWEVQVTVRGGQAA